MDELRNERDHSGGPAMSTSLPLVSEQSIRTPARAKPNPPPISTARPQAPSIQSSPAPARGLSPPVRSAPRERRIEAESASRATRSRRRLIPSGVIAHRDTWISWGVTSRRLASAEFTSPFPGWHHESSWTPSLAQIARVIQTQHRPGAALWAVSAAEVLQLPLPEHLTYARTGQIHLASPNVRGGGHRGRLVMHRWAGESTFVARGIVLAPLECILRALAIDLTERQLVAALDALLIPARSWREDRTANRAMSRTQLLEVIAAAGGGPGHRRLERAAALCREGVDSVQETALRLVICSLGFVEPDVNPQVADPKTGATYYLDLACPGRLLALEYDGRLSHHMTPAQRRHDRTRQDALHALGYRVLRVDAEDLRDLAYLAAQLDAMGWPLRPGGARVRSRMLAAGRERGWYS